MAALAARNARVEGRPMLRLAPPPDATATDADAARPARRRADAGTAPPARTSGPTPAAGIGRIAEARGVPLLLGGPSFNIEATAEAWRSVPGLAALVGAEVDLDLPAIVEAVVDGGDVLK